MKRIVKSVPRKIIQLSHNITIAIVIIAIGTITIALGRITIFLLALSVNKSGEEVSPVTLHYLRLVPWLPWLVSLACCLAWTLHFVSSGT